MKIVLHSLGALSEVQPFITLANSLSLAGHEVTLLTNKDYEQFIKVYDISYKLFPFTNKQVIDDGFNIEHFNTKPKKFLNHYHEQFKTLYGMVIDSSKEADLIIANDSIIGIVDICEKFKLPLIKLNSSPSCAYATTLSFSNSSTEKSSINMINEFRQYFLNLEERKKEELDDYPLKSFYANSKYIFDESDISESEELVGLTLFPPNKALPERVVNFINAGEEPIILNLNFLLLDDADAFLYELQKSLYETNNRAIVISESERIKKFEKDYLLISQDVSLNLLASNSKYIIHSGSLYDFTLCLMYAKPSIPIPVSKTQNYYSTLFNKLNCCTSSLNYKKIKSKHITEMIETLSEPIYLHSNNILKEKINSEDPIAIIMQFIASLEYNE